MLDKIKENKKIIIIMIVVVAVLGVIVFRASQVVKKKEDKSLIYNNNESFIKNQKVKGVIFKDVSCTYDGNNSLISYKIVNSNKKKIHLNKYDVLVKDKDKKILTKIVVKYDQELDVNKEYDMANQVVGVDLTDSYYMDFELDIDDNK